MKKILMVCAVLIIAVVAYLGYRYMNNDTPSAQPSSQTQTPVPIIEQPGNKVDFTFALQKKSAHFVSTSPEHEKILDKVPDKVTINFDFDLTSKSTISVTYKNTDVSSGEVIIGEDGLSLSKKVNIESNNKGVYTVKYSACWPDGSCHDGQYQFGVK